MTEDKLLFFRNILDASFKLAFEGLVIYGQGPENRVIKVIGS